MSTTKKAAKKPASKKASKKGAGGGGGALDARTIRVRMYRIGFGDCFLLSLPIAKGSETAKGHRHVLIDCGVHGQGDINTMEAAIDDIAAVTNRTLAAVIATHSHQDHISGFSRYGEKFSGFDIDEVWLPWCENTQDGLALKMQRKHVALADQLEEHFAAQAAAASPQGRTPERAAAASAVANLVGNQKAMQLLRSGFGVNARVRYLEAGETLTNPANIPGLSVRVLGPPRDEKFLAKMNPPEDQRYLRLGAGGAAEVANGLRPFSPRWEAPRADPRLSHLALRPAEERDLRDEIADGSLDGLAFALDQAKNNTSLVTLFVFRGQYLLFPGDAQYGNWKWWLDQTEAEDILPRISFLKVAHHGSHNATPKDALERMAQGGFAAMISTQNAPWGSIPRIPLVERLSEKTAKRVVRSDWIKVAGAPTLKNTPPPVPAKLPKGFRQGKFWFDYLIKV
ncbi:MAG TPA: MBL fold metallo-hydrolase [Pyrinomonadaceae bacterium]|jgi:beta-lactamase superfamily II metal-dependent hydrolase